MSLLQQIIDRTASLYSLPEVALEVLELTNQPRVDLSAFKTCIERDPALTSKLLKVVNSSLFGLSRRVVDLGQAISLLGVKPLKMLVLGFSLPKDLSNDIETLALSRYWRHTLVKAVACRELAEQCWEIAGDEPFIAGLLQDIGQLVLLQQVGEPYQRFLQRAYDSSRPIAELEMSALGFDHAIVSARILEKWGLPPHLVQAVAAPLAIDQINQLPITARPLPQILHLGELIAQLLTRHPEGKLQELLNAAHLYKQIEFSQLRDLIQTLEAKVAAFGEVLSLYQPDGPAFSEILAEAHRRLAIVAEDASFDLAGSAARVLRETQELSADLKSAVALRQTKNSPPGSGNRDSDWNISNVQHETVASKTKHAHAPEQLLASTRWQRTVATAIEQGRQQRASISLLLVQIDHYSEVVFTHGPDQAQRLTRLLDSGVRAITAGEGECALAGEGRFAAWWIGFGRSHAVEQGRQLVRRFQEWLQSKAEFADQRITISVGVATLPLPTRNFPPADLIAPAERCLSTAQTSGGNCVKSIEV